MQNHALNYEDVIDARTGANRTKATSIIGRLIECGSSYVGTGTTVQTFFSGLSGSSIIESVDEPKEKTSIKEIQDFIRLAFGLTMDELATTCHKGRKTMYDWAKGAEPRPDAADRLFSLYRAAKDWLDHSDPMDKRRLREPLVLDGSLLDLLTADDIDFDAISHLRKRIDLDSFDSLEIEGL